MFESKNSNDDEEEVNSEQEQVRITLTKNRSYDGSDGFVLHGSISNTPFSCETEAKFRISDTLEAEYGVEMEEYLDVFDVGDKIGYLTATTDAVNIHWYDDQLVQAEYQTRSEAVTSDETDGATDQDLHEAFTSDDDQEDDEDETEEISHEFELVVNDDGEATVKNWKISPMYDQMTEDVFLDRLRANGALSALDKYEYETGDVFGRGTYTESDGEATINLSEVTPTRSSSSFFGRGSASTSGRSSATETETETESETDDDESEDDETETDTKTVEIVAVSTGSTGVAQEMRAEPVGYESIPQIRATKDDEFWAWLKHETGKTPSDFDLSHEGRVGMVYLYTEDGVVDDIQVKSHY